MIHIGCRERREDGGDDSFMSNSFLLRLFAVFFTADIYYNKYNMKDNCNIDLIV